MRSAEIRPILRRLHSPDLEQPALPPAPSDCVVLCQALVGPSDGPGEESFDFVVVTPRSLTREGLPLWGRGYLVVREFNWDVVDTALDAVLSTVTGTTWQEVAAALNRRLMWEFDEYRPFKGPS